jgi:hypothetical protein
LNDTTSFLNLALSFGANIAGFDNDGDVNSALPKKLGVAVGEEVDDGSGIWRRLGEVLVALLGGNKCQKLDRLASAINKSNAMTDLLKVHDRLPVVVAEKVEMPHADLICSVLYSGSHCIRCTFPK